MKLTQTSINRLAIEGGKSEAIFFDDGNLRPASRFARSA